MEWVEAINEAVRFMESCITEDITVNNVAEHVHILPFHFHRGFSMLCGYSVTEYIRNRRLPLAGEELMIGETTVLTFAVKYGYDSVDSFSRAFCRFHGVLPGAVKRGAILKNFAPLKLTIRRYGFRSRKNKRKHLGMAKSLRKRWDFAIITFGLCLDMAVRKMLFSVFAGRHACFFLKLGGQIIAVAVAGFHGDVHHGFIAFGKQHLDMAQTDIPQIFRKGFAELRGEKSGKICRGKVCVACQFFERQVFCIVGFHIIQGINNRLCQLCAVAGGCNFRQPLLPYGGEKAQQHTLQNQLGIGAFFDRFFVHFLKHTENFGLGSFVEMADPFFVQGIYHIFVRVFPERL